MMTPGVYNFSLYRGATLRQPFYRKTARGGPAFDLTGYGALATIRTTKIADATPPIIELTAGNGGIVLDGPGGKVEMFMTHTQVISLLVANKHFYDLFLLPPNGDRLPFVVGELTFL